MSCLGGCGFHGSPATAGYCSVCARKKGISVTTSPPPASKATGYGKESKLVFAISLTTGQQVEVRHGDLTRESVAAIVNAANGQLRHASGVAGALVKVGGQIIQDVSDIYIAEHGEIPVSGVVTMDCVGSLPCKMLIHAVGPTWHTGHMGEIQQLEQCILNILKDCTTNGGDSVSIPAISSGVFGFPKELCASIMLTAIVQFFEANTESPIRRVCLTNFDDDTVGIFLREVKSYVPGAPRSLPEPPPLTDEMRRYLAMSGGTTTGYFPGMMGNLQAEALLIPSEIESRVLRDGRVLESRCANIAKTSFHIVVCSEQTKKALGEAGGPVLQTELLRQTSLPGMCSGGELLAKKIIIISEVKGTGNEGADCAALEDELVKAWEVMSMLGSSMNSVDIAPIGKDMGSGPSHARSLVGAVLRCICKHPAHSVRGIRITTPDKTLATSLAEAIRLHSDSTQEAVTSQRHNESATQRRARERSEAEAALREKK